MKLLLRAENAVLLLAALAAYHLTDGSWWVFLLLILAPDLSMLGYLVGPRMGAWSYNALHSWIAAVLLCFAGLATGSLFTVHLAIILAAHIAADRMLGYGLKHKSGFQDTHLGRIGN